MPTMQKINISGQTLSPSATQSMQKIVVDSLKTPVLIKKNDSGIMSDKSNASIFMGMKKEHQQTVTSKCYL